MPARIRFLFSTLSLALFFVAAAPLYRELSLRSDIWWTPHAMLVPLAESEDRVRVMRLPLLLVYAALWGVTACIFVLVLTGRLAYRSGRGV